MISRAIWLPPKPAPGGPQLRRRRRHLRHVRPGALRRPPPRLDGSMVLLPENKIVLLYHGWWLGWPEMPGPFARVGSFANRASTFQRFLGIFGGVGRAKYSLSNSHHQHRHDLHCNHNTHHQKPPPPPPPTHPPSPPAPRPPQ